MSVPGEDEGRRSCAPPPPSPTALEQTATPEYISSEQQGCVQAYGSGLTLQSEQGEVLGLEKSRRQHTVHVCQVAKEFLSGFFILFHYLLARSLRSRMGPSHPSSAETSSLTLFTLPWRWLGEEWMGTGMGMGWRSGERRCGGGRGVYFENNVVLKKKKDTDEWFGI